jgi:hypothetical protein
MLRRFTLSLALVITACVVAVASPAVAFAGEDVTPPYITDVRIVNPVVQKPGIVNIAVDFVEDGTGVDLVSGTVTQYGEHGDGTTRPYSNYLSNVTLYTGTVILPIAIPGNAPAGLWQVGGFAIRDHAGNTSSNSISTWAFHRIGGSRLQRPSP